MIIENLIKNQPEVVKMIDNSIQKNKLVHAYLFEGDKGTMKMDAALYFAASLLCSSEHKKPCTKCKNCERVFFGQHTNVYTVEPFNNVIRKDQIEALIHELSSTSLEDGSRIFIIKDAELMNTSASNALLKFLEEPFPHQYIILLTTQPQLLLSTIRSRVQTIRFRPMSVSNMTKLLTEKGVNPDIAYVISNLTSNIDEANEIINRGHLTDIIELVENIQKARNKNQDGYVAFLKSSKFLFQEDGTFHKTFFNVMMLFVREKIKYLNKLSDVHFVDVISKVNYDNENQDNLIKQLETLSEYQERMKYHVNMDLLYASLFLEL